MHRFSRFLSLALSLSFCRSPSPSGNGTDVRTKRKNGGHSDASQKNGAAVDERVSKRVAELQGNI
jgi:hypothetical protein